MKNKFWTIALAAVLVVALALIACGCNPQAADKVVEIKLNTTLVTVEYELGDAFTIGGLKVTAVYESGKTENVNLKELTVSKPDMNVEGEQTITVKWNGLEASYKITVIDPDKVIDNEWKADFTVKADGVVELSAIKAYLIDSGAGRLGPSDVDPGVSVGGMVAGDKVVYRFNADKAAKAKLTIDFDHSGHGNTPVSNLIEFNLNGTKLQTEADFNAGEEGHSHAAWMCYQKTLIGEVDIAEGKNTLVMTFLGNGSNLKSIILDFGGKEPAPEATVNGIVIDTDDVQTEFALEETFNSNGLVVKKTYTDGTEVVVSEGVSVTGGDTSSAGKKTVTVTWDKYSKTYEINVADKAKFVVEPTETNSKFVLSALQAELDPTIKIDETHNDVGGIAAANAPSIFFKISANIDAQAKLLLDMDDYFKGSAVNTILDVYINGEKLDLDGVMFVTPADGHEHIDWHCNNATLLGKVAIATDKVNVIELRFKADATNVFGITIDYSEDQPEPEEKTYIFDAENALLVQCMTEFKTGVGAHGDALVGDTGEDATQTFTVYAAKAVTVSVRFRIASGGATTLDALVKNFTVNGIAVNLTGIDVPAGQGASWYQWTSGTVGGVELQAGKNVLAMSAQGNFDYIAIDSNAVLSDTVEGVTLTRLDGTKATKEGGCGDENGHEGWINNIAAGNKITFSFTATAGAKGMLALYTDHQGSVKPDVSAMIKITVNGVEYTTTARYAYCGGTCPDTWHHAIEVKLGEIQLHADNTIVIEFLTDNNSNFNGIGIYADCDIVAK